MSHITRRELMARLGVIAGTAVVGLASPISAATRARAQVAAGEALMSLTPAEAEIVRAVVARLIPSDQNGPGALEARADRYIDRALAGALKASRSVYSTGLADINTRAQSLKGNAFAKLPAADQDAVLSAVQQGSAQFFNLIRTHTIQGTFGDPFYGGNKDFVGWDLIGYPGARTAVSAEMQRLDRKPEPSRKSAYDYGMFSKAEI